MDGLLPKEKNADAGWQFLDLQEVLKKLSRLNPDACLKKIAEELGRRLNCETVSILLWNEARQELKTEYVYGMPKSLKGPEKYKADQGITGKLIFREERRVRALVDFDTDSIIDAESNEVIKDPTIHWNSMRRFKAESVHREFKSLLGAPLFTKKQKIGVVKLINRVDEQTNRLAEDGFSADDLVKLGVFLDVIEHVIETKRGEKQIDSLIEIGHQNTRSVFNFREVVKEIAWRCAEVLNYHLCVIRLEDHGQFRVAVGSDKPLNARRAPRVPFAKALAANVPIKWQRGWPELRTFDDRPVYTAEEIEPELAGLGIQSCLLVPIKYQRKAVGTIECYTTLLHDFSLQEVNLINAYAIFLVIALMNSTQQRLLNGLIGVPRIETTWEVFEEEQLIEKMLNPIRDSLGQGGVSLAILFSRSRLEQTELKCGLLYGVDEAGLCQLVSEDACEQIASMLAGKSDSPFELWERPDDYTIGGGPKPIHVHPASIRLTPDGQALGVILAGVRGGGGVDAFSKSVVDFSAKYIGVALGYIDRLRKIERLPQIINLISKKEKFEDIRDLILQETISFFGFDYATISRVDYAGKRVKTEKGKTSKPDRVDPEQWKYLSNYNLNTDIDILVDIVEKKQSVVINGPTALAEFGDKLNLKIFHDFNHKDLIRVLVPFTFQKKAADDKKESRVLGIIEAGYHITTRREISKHQRELFEVFVNYCAESLQRVNLLEQRSAIEEIVQRLSKQTNPRAVLEELVQGAVNLVRADSGMIMFLTHLDENLDALDDPIQHGLTEAQKRKLTRSILVQESGKRIGIVAHAVALNQSYWSNNVDEDDFYIKEFDEVKSELAVPLRYYGKPIGVLDLYAYRENWFDETKKELLETIAEQATLRFQDARNLQSLGELGDPFSLFSSLENIYKGVIDIIERFLKTDAVRIWEKEVTKDGFLLHCRRASDRLEACNAERGVWSEPLPQESFSGRAVQTRAIVEVDHQEINSGNFRDAEFARQNGLKSMTSVPILTGQQAYGVIDVFSHRDTKLFPQEKSFLEAMASKAAIAIQNAKLIESFNNISTALARGDIDEILRTITNSACQVLHADPVVLYRYEPEQKRFAPPHPIFSGNYFYPEVKDLAGVREGDFVNLILKKGTQYVENEQKYFNLQKKIKRDKKDSRFKEDFWTREKIKSMAALRLDHPSGVLGVMFINYRTPRTFDDPTKALVSGFGAQAASAIARGRLLEQNRHFWELQRRDSLSLQVNELLRGMVHNSGNVLDSMLLKSFLLSRTLRKAPDCEAKQSCLGLLQELQAPLGILTDEFQRLREFGRFSQFEMKRWSVEELIDETLQLLKDRFEGKIAIHKDYRWMPHIWCDKRSLQHVLLNLFLNSYDAMKKKGSLSIETRMSGSYVQINITDSGGGIPEELRPRIFELFFTTKREEGGTGVGLSVSRYIIQSHGGRIEFESGKHGTTFCVFLPTHRREEDAQA